MRIDRDSGLTLSRVCSPEGCCEVAEGRSYGLPAARLRALGPYAAIFILATALYIPTISFPLGNLDEQVIITSNMKLLSDPSHLGEVFFRDAFMSPFGMAFYRPLQNASFVLDACLGRGRSEGFRVMNLVYHGFACATLFAFLQLFSVKRAVAFFFAATYAVHPLFTHAALWLPSRGDLLLALFSMLALLVLEKYLKGGNRAWSALHALLLFGAVGAKETGAALPVLAVLYVLLFRRGVSVARLAYPVVFDAAAVSGYFALRAAVVTAAPADGLFGFDVFLANLATVPEVAAKFLFPLHGLSAMAMFSRATTLTGVAVIALVLAWVYTSRQHQPVPRAALFGFAWFLLLLAPGMFYRLESWKQGYDYLEQRAYAPLLGLAVLLAVLIDQIPKKRRYFTIGGAYLLLFAYLAAARSGEYRDAYTFYTAIIHAAPQNALAHNNLGAAYQHAQDYDAALREYAAALRVSPAYVTARYNKARIEFFQNNLAASLDDFNNILEVDPKHAAALSGRGMVKYAREDFEGALADFNAAIAAAPQDSAAHNGRGSVLAVRGRLKEAVAEFELALRYDPSNEEARGNLKRLTQRPRPWPQSGPGHPADAQ